MPKELENKLKKEARSKGLSKERADAYVYGTLRKTGWVPNKVSKNNTKKVKMSEYEHSKTGKC